MQADEQTRETVAAIRALRDLMEAGKPVDEGEVSVLMAQIRDLVPTILPSEVAILKSEVDALILLASEIQRSVSDELKRLRNGRKGLVGYNHIRGYDTQQRLSRTA